MCILVVHCKFVQNIPNFGTIRQEKFLGDFRLTLAFLFPGQGSQIIGMGQALATEYPASRQVFEEVDDTLNESLSALMWNGEIEELTLTRNAQPALMAVSIAGLRALESEGVDVCGAAFMAGHSLGEYSALCAAGAISLADAARLLRIRGHAMQESVEAGEGAMAALLGLDFETVTLIAKTAAEDQICKAANYNDPKQVVVSGNRDAVGRAVALAREKGARRAVMLAVSAPFHCDLMAPAAKIMANALADIEFSPARVPIVANVSARPYPSMEEIPRMLVEQITGVVLWKDTIQWLTRQGVNGALEIGPGNALSGMVRRTDRAVSCYPASNPDQVKRISEMLEKGDNIV